MKKIITVIFIILLILIISPFPRYVNESLVSSTTNETQLINCFTDIKKNFLNNHLADGKLEKQYYDLVNNTKYEEITYLRCYYQIPGLRKQNALKAVTQEKEIYIYTKSHSVTAGGGTDYYRYCLKVDDNMVLSVERSSIGIKEIKKSKCVVGLPFSQLIYNSKKVTTNVKYP